MPMAPMPPQGGGAPAQGAPQPQGQPPQQGGAGSAAQFAQMIMKGFQGLGQAIKSAGSSLPPEDIQLFQSASKATEAMIQSLSQPSGPPQGAQPPKQQPGGPMTAHQSAGSKPAQF